MFEIVFETRKEGQDPGSDAAPLTSLVLSSKFETEEKARRACLGFQSPFEEKWEDRGRFFGKTLKEPGKVSIWYVRAEE